MNGTPEWISMARPATAGWGHVPSRDTWEDHEPGANRNLVN